MKKRFSAVIAGAAAVCMLTSGCGKADKADTVPKLKVYEFGKNDIVRTLKVSGLVESTDKNSTITTELTDCKVNRLNFVVGDRIKKDDIICELDTTDIQKEIADLEKVISDSKQLSDYDLDQYRQNLEKTRKNGDDALENAQKSIDDAKKAYDDQKSQYDNYRSRYSEYKNAADEMKVAAENAESDEEKAAYSEQYRELMSAAGSAMAAYEAAYSGMQQAESAVRMSENAYSQTRREVESSISAAQYQVDRYSLASGGTSEDQKKLDELKSKLDKAVVRADKDGLVVSVMAEEGKTCPNGIILTIQSYSDMCVHINIDESDLLDVKSGMDAEITIPARENEKYTGKVGRIIDIKSPAGFDGYINIDDTSDFRIGMTASATIVLNDSSDMLSVKNSSIFKNEDKESCVYEAEKQSDGTYLVRQVTVQTGEKNENYTVISGDGLSEGDYIVSTPSRCKAGDIIDVSVSAPKKDKAGEADE